MNQTPVKSSYIERVMENGDKVRVKLAGDETWYNGIVIKARKQWVELFDYPFDERFIADENNIIKCELIENHK